MKIVKVIVELANAADPDGVARAVAVLGSELFGLAQCGASWQPPALSHPWWKADPDGYAALYARLERDHTPVASGPGRDGMHRLLLPVIQPGGLVGAICCGHPEPFTPELQRELSALAAHTSVRLVQIAARPPKSEVLARLTPRQADVALLAASGRTNAAIAAALGLSENTVKKHLKDIFETLDVGNRTELAIRCCG